MNDVQSSFFRIREPELLFDVESDLFETVNNARDKEWSSVLLDMRKGLNIWIKEMPDLSFYPEHFLIDSAFANPTEFGKQHKKEISKYVNVVNLSLTSYDIIQDKLAKSLNSPDPWERYWALITSTTFGKEAEEFVPLISSISRVDPELINRVRASEFLAIVSKINPTVSITNCLYKSNRPSEALLILNSIVLMQSFGYGFDFKIELEKMSDLVSDDNQVKRRLKFLKVT